MVERKIKFQYFVFEQETKNDGHWESRGTFNLINWIDHVNTNGLEQKIVELNDTKARIEKIKHIDGCWAVQMMKLREDNLPHIVREYEDAEDIDLEDDEYIGEDMYMMYNIDNGVAMIQVNRFSLGIRRLGEFLSQSMNLENERITIKAVSSNVEVNNFRGHTYRDIELGFANLQYVQTTQNSALGAIMNAYGRLQGLSGRIKIGVGRCKDESLDIIEVDNLLQEIREEECIISAKVKIRDDDMARTEVIDLFDNVVSDTITFSLPARTTLAFDYATISMKNYFDQRIEEILNLINP